MARKRSAFLLSALLAGAAPAQTTPAPTTGAQPSEAEQIKALYQKGKAEYDLGNYEEAVKYFEDVYRRKPLAGLLFNIAQCYRFVGNLDKAATTFKAFLRNATAGDSHIPQAKELLAEIDKSLAQQEKVKSAKPQGLGPAPVPPPTPGSAQAELAPSATPPPKLPPPSTPVIPPPPAASASSAKAPATTPGAPPAVTPPVVTPPASAPPPAKLAVVQKQPPPAPAPSIEMAPPPPVAEKKSHIATWVTGGVGVVALGTGGFFGLKSKSLQSDLQASTHTREQIDADSATAKSDASKANALMIGGAVLVVAAGVLFFLGY